MTLKEYLQQKNINNQLWEIILSLQVISHKIHKALIHEDKDFSDKSNTHWENQMNLDIICDEIMIKEFSLYDWIWTLVSEEQELPIKLNELWKYLIAYDPIDWSSLLDVNLSVWSIFWIFESSTIIWKKVKDMVCAWCIIYWPRTTLLISFWDEVVEFTLHENKEKSWHEFHLTKKDIRIKEETKIFSPWNLRACKENPKYMKCINKWLTQQKTLRYSWWMVPDVNAIFLKWEWIFSYPPDSKHTNWKLRLAYEVWPFSFLAKAAWAESLTHKWESIIDLEIKDIHERCPIIVGSKNEVNEIVKMLNES